MTEIRNFCTFEVYTLTPASFASFSLTYALRLSGVLPVSLHSNQGTVTTLAHCLAKRQSRSSVLAVLNILEASR